MAGHAGFGRGDAGEGTRLNGGVAVAAVDAVAADVALVAEGDGLFARDVALGDHRPPIKRGRDAYDSCCTEHNSPEAPLDEPVRAWRKNLSHGVALSTFSDALLLKLYALRIEICSDVLVAGGVTLSRCACLNDCLSLKEVPQPSGRFSLAELFGVPISG